MCKEKKKFIEVPKELEDYIGGGEEQKTKAKVEYDKPEPSGKCKVCGVSLLHWKGEYCQTCRIEHQVNQNKNFSKEKNQTLTDELDKVIKELKELKEDYTQLEKINNTNKSLLRNQWAKEEEEEEKREDNPGDYWPTDEDLEDEIEKFRNEIKGIKKELVEIKKESKENKKMSKKMMILIFIVGLVFVFATAILGDLFGHLLFVSFLRIVG